MRKTKLLGRVLFHKGWQFILAAILSSIIVSSSFAIYEFALPSSKKLYIVINSNDISNRLDIQEVEIKKQFNLEIVEVTHVFNQQVSIGGIVRFDPLYAEVDSKYGDVLIIPRYKCQELAVLGKLSPLDYYLHTDLKTANVELDNYKFIGKDGKRTIFALPITMYPSLKLKYGIYDEKTVVCIPKYSKNPTGVCSWLNSMLIA